jgi:hypothetical protein
MSRRRNERELGGAIPLTKKGRAGVAAARKWLAEADQPRKAVQVPRLEDYVQGIRAREKPNRRLKPTELYDRGKLIVRFLCLGDSEEEARQFQKDHPLYFPREFWTLKLPSGDDLHSGLLIGFEPETKSLPARPFWQGYRDLLRAAWEHRFGDDEYITRLLSIGKPIDLDDDDFIKQNLAKLPLRNGVYQFQHDVIALVREPWRARNCELPECRNPFVPDKGSRRCCSTACSIKAGRARKRRWWNSKKNKRKHIVRLAS